MIDSNALITLHVLHASAR